MPMFVVAAMPPRLVKGGERKGIAKLPWLPTTRRARCRDGRKAPRCRSMPQSRQSAGGSWRNRTVRVRVSGVTSSFGHGSSFPAPDDGRQEPDGGVLDEALKRLRRLQDSVRQDGHQAPRDPLRDGGMPKYETPLSAVAAAPFSLCPGDAGPCRTSLPFRHLLRAVSDRYILSQNNGSRTNACNMVVRGSHATSLVMQAPTDRGHGNRWNYGIGRENSRIPIDTKNIAAPGLAVP